MILLARQLLGMRRILFEHLVQYRLQMAKLVVPGK
jgi:hypothetical protein